MLFLFVIMMVNIRLSEILELGNQYTKNLSLAFIVGFLFIYEIFSIIPFSFNNINILNFPIEVSINILNFINDLTGSAATIKNNIITLVSQANPKVASEINYIFNGAI